MSIGRITMIEFTSDEAMKAAAKLYLATQKENFPNAQAVINVKTGPFSMMSLAIYESYEEAEKNLVGRNKYMDAVAITVKDTFYYEGDLHTFSKTQTLKLFPNIPKKIGYFLKLKEEQKSQVKNYGRDAVHHKV